MPITRRILASVAAVLALAGPAVPLLQDLASHHVIYFYTLAGRPDKAIELTPGNHGNPGNVGSTGGWRSSAGERAPSGLGCS